MCAVVCAELYTSLGLVKFDDGRFSQITRTGEFPL